MSTRKKKPSLFAGSAKPSSIGSDLPEIHVPPQTTTVRVTTPDTTVAQLLAKIEGAKTDLREIMANGRNPASGMARKALAKLES